MGTAPKGPSLIVWEKSADKNDMPHKTLKINNIQELPAIYKGTPVEALIRYQNFNLPYEKYQQAQLLIGMCIDYRKHLNIPGNFAYIIRTAGANLRLSEFRVSFAIAVGGVSTIALIGHTHCGMVDLESKKEAFIQGLVDRAGWTRKDAEDHFVKNAPLHEIVNETDFVMSEAKRLKAQYPKILIAPMIYDVDDGLLHLVLENK